MPPTHSSPHSPADQRPARPRRPLAVVAVLVAAACALGACDFVPYSGASGSKVFYTGDSLTTMSAAQLDGAFLGRGYRVAGKHYPGTTIGWAGENVRSQVLNQTPDIVVIASGTNNLREPWGAKSDLKSAVALDWAAKTKCSVWVLPAVMSHMEVDGVVVSEPRPGAAEVNARIRELADDRSTQIADWGAHAAAHPEWYQHDDGIHHSTAGRQAYADFIADQTLALCGHP
ncbi:MAG TPA: GDSL-type esterase/lipase family protein [Acidimicrobiales bacterium]